MTTSYYDISIRQIRAQPILSIRTQLEMKDMGMAAQRRLGELFGHIGQQGVRPVVAIVAVSEPSR